MDGWVDCGLWMGGWVWDRMGGCFGDGRIGGLGWIGWG